MLINFSVENYKSFKDQLLLNMTAAKRLKLDRTVPVIKYSMNVLPVSGIYGANGSGKTNLVIAIEFMKAKVCGSNAVSIPFRFASQENEDSPSMFSMLLIDRNGVMYHYGFSIKGDEILEEWLSAYYTKRETELFSRIKTDPGSAYEFGNRFIKETKGGKRYLDFVSNDIPGNKLLLSELAARNSNQICIDVHDWFKNDLVIIRPDYYNLNVLPSLVFDEGYRAKATKILQDLDFDLDGFETKASTIDLEYALNQEVSTEDKETLRNYIEKAGTGYWQSPKQRYAIFRKAEDGRLEEITLVVRHKRSDGTYAALSIADTSSGFKRMLDLLPLLEQDEIGSRTIVVDEIERSLHTVISKGLIEQFLENDLQQDVHSQLIFITHDTNLLDLNILRRDEIQFMEKDRETGASYLTNYAEFRIIPGLNIEKGYLDGRFGAIPLLHHNLK